MKKKTRDKESQVTVTNKNQMNIHDLPKRRTKHTLSSILQEYVTHDEASTKHL